MSDPEGDPAKRPGLAVPLLPQAARWLLAGGMAALILYASLIPRPPSSGDAGLGLFAGYEHVLLYGLLALTLAYALAERPATPWRKALAVVVVTVAYGSLMEGIQLFRPTRYAQWIDAGANLLGALVGSLWCFAEPRIRYRRVLERG